MGTGVMDFLLRPLQNASFCPIFASGSKFNPRVKFIAFLDLEQKYTFIKGLFSFIFKLNLRLQCVTHLSACVTKKIRPMKKKLIKAIESSCPVKKYAHEIRGCVFRM
jgi:hypothetical protein